MPQRWLVKADPEDYGFAHLVKDGRTTWNGVSNPVALKNIRAMKAGDEVLVYETGKVKAIVGTARVAGAPRPDPEDGKLAVVDLEAGPAVGRPVTLAEVKADPAFADFALVRQGRLSVMPVDDATWKRLAGMLKK
jgi:predicted RNA-binding protein with PUA-like domain